MLCNKNQQNIPKLQKFTGRTSIQITQNIWEYCKWSISLHPWCACRTSVLAIGHDHSQREAHIQASRRFKACKTVLSLGTESVWGSMKEHNDPLAHCEDLNLKSIHSAAHLNTVSYYCMLLDIAHSPKVAAPQSILFPDNLASHMMCGKPPGEMNQW